VAAGVREGGRWRGFPGCDVGTRVVARRSLGADGGPPYGDVLGVLVRTGPVDMVIETRAGPVTVALDSVVAARRVSETRPGARPR
jgi:hypothetical protein